MEGLFSPDVVSGKSILSSGILFTDEDLALIKKGKGKVWGE